MKLSVTIVFSLPKRFNSSDCAHGAQQFLKIQINGFLIFENISRSVIHQRFKFVTIVVFGLLKTSNGSDYHVGSLNWKKKKKKKSRIVISKLTTTHITVAQHIYTLKTSASISFLPDFEACWNRPPIFLRFQTNVLDLVTKHPKSYFKPLCDNKRIKTYLPNGHVICCRKGRDP